MSSYTILHKFYVSVTQVEYNNEQHSAQIISRIFIDDIEDVLQKRYDESINFDTDLKDPKLQKYLSLYLSSKLSFEINSQKVFFNFVGKEVEEDLLICYLEIENISSIKSIKVTNHLLMDLYEEQQNIIHVKSGKQRKSLILEKDKAMSSLHF